MTESGISPNAVELPCDCQPAEPPPVVAPRTLYTINSARPRWQIIRDYAAAHNLTVAEIDQLVRALPDYGLRAQLHGSLALITARPGVVVSMAAERHRRRG